MHTECPNENCSAVWGFSEMHSQQCDACGWPYNKDADHPEFVADPESKDDVADADPDDADYFKW